MFSELHGLSERWFQAWLEKDAATVERLMAEDYLYVGPSGLVLDRQAILAIVRSPSYRLDQGTRTEDARMNTIDRPAPASVPPSPPPSPLGPPPTSAANTRANRTAPDINLPCESYAAIGSRMGLTVPSAARRSKAQVRDLVGR